MNSVFSVRARGARGPRGLASGPLGAGSVSAEEISNSTPAQAEILAKLGGIDMAALQAGLDTKVGVPRNNRVALLGDSITEAGKNADTADEIRNANRGMTFWVPFLTHQQFVSPRSLNFGISGQTSAQIAARVGDVIESGAGICVVLAGTNDIGGFTAEQTKTNLSTIYSALATANILIIALPILPRTLSTEPTYSFPQELNEWMRQQGQHYAGFKFIDPFLFGDPYSLTYSPRTGYTYDGLHPMAIGMRYVSKPVTDYLNTLVPVATPQIRSVTDYFNASNPRGVLNDNPMLAGSGGSPSGIGDVADDYNIGANAGGGDVASLVTTASKNVSAAGMVNQRIVLSGSATGGFDTNVIFSTSVGTSDLNAGDTIELLSDVEVIGGTTGISGIAAYAFATQAGTPKFVYDGYAVVSDDLTVDGFSGTFRTPPLVLTADPTAAGIGIKISLKNTGTARSIDLRINNMALRKVI